MRRGGGGGGDRYLGTCVFHFTNSGGGGGGGSGYGGLVFQMKINILLAVFDILPLTKHVSDAIPMLTFVVKKKILNPQWR
jgi:hypothetical protein